MFKFSVLQAIQQILFLVSQYSFLKIPTTHTSKDLLPPKGKSAEILQQNCEDLQVLLVDERSLMDVELLDGWNLCADLEKITVKIQTCLGAGF